MHFIQNQDNMTTLLFIKIYPNRVPSYNTCLHDEGITALM